MPSVDNKPVAFRRVKGRVIPIRAESAARVGLITAGTYASAAGASVQGFRPKIVKPNKFLASAGLGLAVASGVLSGATFFSKGKKFWIAQGVGLGLDVASSALGAAAFAGRDNVKERAKGVAKIEGQYQIAGYGAMAATLLSRRSSRMRTLVYGRKAGRELVTFARKVRHAAF